MSTTLELSIFIFRDIKVRTWSWSANFSTVHVIQLLRQVLIFLSWNEPVLDSFPPHQTTKDGSTELQRLSVSLSVLARSFWLAGLCVFWLGHSGWQDYCLFWLGHSGWQVCCLFWLSHSGWQVCCLVWLSHSSWQVCCLFWLGHSSWQVFACFVSVILAGRSVLPGQHRLGCVTGVVVGNYMFPAWTPVSDKNPLITKYLHVINWLNNRIQ